MKAPPILTLRQAQGRHKACPYGPLLEGRNLPLPWVPAPVFTGVTFFRGNDGVVGGRDWRGGDFREKCTKVHNLAHFVAEGLSQVVVGGVSNREILGTFRDKMGVRRGLAGGGLGAR